MLRRATIRLFFFLMAIFALTGCNLPSGNSGANNAAQQTGVAQTVEALRPTVDLTNEPTGGFPTQTQGDAPSASKDDATFIADVTFPDYTYVEVGVEFTKTWRLQNSGDTTWTTAYALVFDKGETMGAPDSVSIPKEVNPGETVDISIKMTAPETPGEFQSWWMLQNAGGESFGVGKDSDQPIFVIINSVVKQQSGPGIAGGADITQVTISANQTSYSGACPATFVFTGNIVTSDSGHVQWTLNLNTSKAGFKFDDTGVYSLNFDGAGTKSWQYTLFISSSVSATAQVAATGSGTVTSAPLGFNVTCQ